MEGGLGVGVGVGDYTQGSLAWSGKGGFDTGGIIYKGGLYMGVYGIFTHSLFENM